MSAQRTNVLLALDWYHPTLHMGVARFARENHWHLNTEMVRSGNILPSGWRGNGVLAGASLIRKIRKAYPWLGANMVQLAHVPGRHPGYHSISDDHVAIAKCSASYLCEKGFRNFVCYCPRREWVGERITSFRHFVEKRGFRCRLLVAKKPDWIDRHQWLMAELGKLPTGTAIFCQNDEFAAEIIEACMDAGIEVPGRLGVIGVRNDALISEALHTPLTSVDNNLVQVGYQAASLLADVMRGKAGAPRHHLVSPIGVVERASTSLFASELSDAEFHRAMLVIRDQAHEASLDCRDLASRCGVSLRKLYLIFSRSHTRKPSEEITLHRLGLARKLLLSVDLPMEEVVAQSGFGNTRSFYKAFHQYEGVTPARFRKNGLLSG